MSAPALRLVRHAESTWNAAGRWQGQGDPPLSGGGRRQARRLARACSGVAIQRILTSDLARAAETAVILGDALSLEPDVDPRLRERDLGAWTGRSGAEIAARWPAELARLRAGDPTLRPGGGETLGELRERVAKALDDLAASGRPGRLLVVSHLGVIRLLTAGQEPDNATWIDTDAPSCRRLLRDEASGG